MSNPFSEPIKDLYICYLQGRLNPSSVSLGNFFIGNWEEEGFSFLFFSKPSRDEVNRLLTVQPQLIFLDEFEISYEDWQGGKLEPFSIGRFVITPPWMNSDISEGCIPMVLDPGVVFGTGTHPTTGDCLDLIDCLCAAEPIRTVLDMGTGTGILAIAAAKCGCQSVLALDFNFLAAKTAAANVRLNALDDQIIVIQGKAEDFIGIPSDLMIANIHYDVMDRLIRSEGFLTTKWFILSGLLRSQAADVAYQLSKLPVHILEKRERDGIWHTFFGNTLRFDQ